MIDKVAHARWAMLAKHGSDAGLTYSTGTCHNTLPRGQDFSPLRDAALLRSTIMSKPQHDAEGPFRADQLKDGDRYELSHGHAIHCAPGGPEHASKNLTGASALDSDPDAEWAGVDAGYSPAVKTLRAPDVAVGPAPKEKSGWIPGAPPLAVEFAAHGQDEKALQAKIHDLLAAGTQRVWVVRLVGPRRVEEHQPGQPQRTYTDQDTLHAPGVLRNSVPVRTFFERDAAHQATLRNLLQRQGYESLEAVRAEARSEGQAKSILVVLEKRGLTVSAGQRRRVLACQDPQQLDRWLDRALQISTSEALFE